MPPIKGSVNVRRPPLSDAERQDRKQRHAVSVKKWPDVLSPIKMEIALLILLIISIVGIVGVVVIALNAGHDIPSTPGPTLRPFTRAPGLSWACTTNGKSDNTGNFITCDPVMDGSGTFESEQECKDGCRCWQKGGPVGYRCQGAEVCLKPSSYPWRGSMLDQNSKSLLSWNNDSNEKCVCIDHPLTQDGSTTNSVTAEYISTDGNKHDSPSNSLQPNMCSLYELYRISCQGMNNPPPDGFCWEWDQS